MIQLLIRTFIRDADNTASRTVRTAYGNLACLVSVLCNLLLFAGKQPLVRCLAAYPSRQTV